jgi:hypothetical protein
VLLGRDRERPLGAADFEEAVGLADNCWAATASKPRWSAFEAQSLKSSAQVKITSPASSRLSVATWIVILRSSSPAETAIY